MVREKNLQVPFSAVTGLMERLEPRDWLMLREWLDEKLAEREDELMLNHPRILRESARHWQSIARSITLGTWQIVFCDFDTRPRSRKLVVQIMGE